MNKLYNSNLIQYFNIEDKSSINFTSISDIDVSNNAIYENTSVYTSLNTIEKNNDTSILINNNLSNIDFQIILDNADSTNQLIDTKDHAYQERIINKIKFLIKNDSFEYGMVSLTDEYLKRLIKTNLNDTLEILNRMFIDCNSDTNIVLGILRILSRLDKDIIKPFGQTIALASLSHKDDEIKECAVRAFENWGGEDSLDILKNVDLGIKWLMQYINNVIIDLESEL